jgi:hypothetical protein
MWQVGCERVIAGRIAAEVIASARDEEQQRDEILNPHGFAFLHSDTR